MKIVALALLFLVCTAIVQLSYESERTFDERMKQWKERQALGKEAQLNINFSDLFRD